MANKPFSIFEKTIARAEALAQLPKKGVEIDEPDDLVRSGVLLSVAAFDRYFTAKFCDVLVAHLKSNKKIGADLYGLLEQAGFSTEFALMLISESVENRKSRPFRKIRTIVQNSLSAHTTHREEKIDKLFLGLGLTKLCINAEKKTKKNGLIKNIAWLVDLRNEIAHEAHVKNTGDPRAINSLKVEKCMSSLRLFVESCDQIIDNKFGVKPAESA